MKAYEINGAGIEHLAMGERPQPHPGYRQVLVRVRATSLNFRDLLMVKGQYSRNLKPKLVPLSDGAGEVAAIGEGVTRFKTGDRVVAIFMQGWLDGEISDARIKTALGGALDGMLAEYVVLDEDGLLPIPEHLSFQEAATLPCAAVTAWNAIMVTANLQTGDSVLALGTGGVSIFTLQLAKLAGAKVIATSSSDAKLERLREMGADATINYKTAPKWGDEVRKLGQVDCVVEVGGAGTMGESLRAVRPGGTIALIGVLAGAAAQMNPMPVVMSAIRLQGLYVGSRAMFAKMNRAIALHRLQPVIDRVFPFDEAAEALRYLESGAHFGKVVIEVG